MTSPEIDKIAFTWAEDADQTLPPPDYASASAVGCDLRLNLPEKIRQKGLHIASNGVVQAPTGLIIALPAHYEAQIRPRSGLAFKKHITVLNSPGTIDSDYRGQIYALLINHGTEMVTLHHGERIAQLIIAPIIRVKFCQANMLDKTPRGQNGFGSTGRH